MRSIFSHAIAFDFDQMTPPIEFLLNHISLINFIFICFYRFFPIKLFDVINSKRVGTANLTVSRVRLYEISEEDKS